MVTESDGYLFIPMYGPRTDWVKNVLVAQAARLHIDGHEIELKSPRLMRKKDVWPMLPTTTKTPPGISSESELPIVTSGMRRCDVEAASRTPLVRIRLCRRAESP